MPAYTANHRLPYPIGTDRVASIDDTGKALAECLDTLIPDIRTGTVAISNVPRLGFAGLSVTFDRPLDSANYTILLTIGGSGNASPEQMTAVYSTGGKTNKGFYGRVRNNANSAQPCEVSYIAIHR